jgi:hypothetical protein
MPSRRHLPFLALATVSLSGLLLSGCVTNNTSDSAPDTPLPESESSQSDGSGDSEQTVAEACSELQTSMQESNTALQDGLSELSADPAAALASLKTFTSEFAATREALGNAEVKQVADDAGVAFEAMVAEVEAGVTDPATFDLSAFMSETVPEVQTQLSAIGEVCTAQ